MPQPPGPQNVPAGRQTAKREGLRRSQGSATRKGGATLAKNALQTAAICAGSSSALEVAVEEHLQNLVAAGYPNVAKGLRYAEEIAAGLIPACKWVKLAVARHKRDLARIGTRGWKYTLNLEAAEQLMRNMQNFREIKGPRAGQYLQLSPWQ